MSERSSTDGTIDAAVPRVPTRAWIDVLLLAGGALAALSGWLLAAAALLTLGSLLPGLRWRTRRSNPAERLLFMVPDELAAAYRDVVAAANLPGVAHPEESIEGAGDLVLEVAAVLGGSSPRRASQRRFVHARTAALETVAVELSERHTAWQRAVEELDAAVPAPADPVKEAPDPAGTGWLSIVFLVALAPAFVLVDGGRLLVRTGLALLDGLALRLRTVVDLVRHGAVVVGRVITDTLRRWRELSALVMASVRRARRRFVAARTLARVRFLRAARRPVR